MREQNVRTYKSHQCRTAFTNGYENKIGDNCQSHNPAIHIEFHQPALAFISKIEVQRDHPKFPGNVQQIEASFIDANGSTILDAVSDTPITWSSPEDRPIITGFWKNMRGVIVKVLKTDNQQTVQRWRVMITGCYTEGMAIEIII